MKDLHATVLSIEWEISDETLVPFLDKISQLVEVYKDDSVALYLLKILKYLGNYVKTHKSDCRPEAVRELGGAYKDFEVVMSIDPQAEAERKEILLKAFHRFKKLKKLLAANHHGRTDTENHDGDNKTGLSKSSLGAVQSGCEIVTQQQLREVVDELKAFIKEEVETLRAYLAAHSS